MTNPITTDLLPTLDAINDRIAAGRDILVDALDDLASVRAYLVALPDDPDEPPVDPPDDPPPDPVPGDFALIPRAELMALPMSGAAWDNVLSWANRSGSIDLSNQDDNDDITVLAAALHFARTEDEASREQVVTMLAGAKGTEAGGRTLALGRNLSPVALAADLIDYREDPEWAAWLRSLLTKTLDGRTLISTHEDRPNNWGTHAGAARMAVDLFLGDDADLVAAVAVFKGYLGDRASYAGFEYGDLSWQADESKPVGINPKGAVKDGVNIDGVIPDDLRRGGSFPKVGSDGENYTWEALQGVLLQAELLYRAGFNAYEWSDRAVRRAFQRAVVLFGLPTGDDEWQTWLVNGRYGTEFATKSPARPGKSFGFTDWLLG